MEFKGRLLSADVYHGQGQDSSSILLYTVPVSIPVTELGLTGEGGMGDCDGEREDEGKRKGRGALLEDAERGWRGPRDEEGAKLCQHM